MELTPAMPPPEPYYTMKNPNDSIDLFVGPIAVNGVEGTGRVWLGWQPEPLIRFEITAKEQVSSEPGECSVHFGDCSAPVAGLLLNLRRGRWDGVLNAPVELGNFAEVTKVVFHQVNFFREPVGIIEPEYGSEEAIPGRLAKAGGGMRLSLDPLSDYHARAEQIRRTGGFCITHIGALRCVRFGNNEHWTSEAVIRGINELFFAASFIAGGWSWPMLQVGLDSDGNRVWEHWERRPVARWQEGVYCWAEGLDCHELSEALGNLMWRAKEDDGGQFRRAIFWYLETNHDRSAESSLVRSQIALELLSWQVAGKALSEEARGKLTAGDLLQLSLAIREIPASIPTQFEELRKYAAMYQAHLGPAAITSVRNAIVHASSKTQNRRSRISDACFREAAALALWYIEMLLLRESSYSGEHANRVVGWKHQDVPWAESMK